MALDDMQGGRWEVDSSAYIYSNFPAMILTECANDPAGEVCSNAPAVKRIKSDFRTCTGYDINFDGPLCPPEASSQLLANDMLTMVVFCTLYAGAEDCLDWHEYFFNFRTSLGMPCYNCIEELETAVIRLRGEPEVRQACNSIESVMSKGCMQLLGFMVQTYMECTGLTLDEGKSTVVSTPSPPSTPSTVSRSAVVACGIWALFMLYVLF
jgi:hypothetical protein